MVATVRNLTSSSATSEYFRQDGGYYLDEGEDAADLCAKRAEHRNGSVWHGTGAEALGLRPGPQVAAGKFERLLQGHVIGTNFRLGRLRDGKREHRPGFNITFSAPKSVSLAALLPTEKNPRGDRAVIRAHDAAVSGDRLRRLKELEKENERLRRAVSDLTLDKQILKEAAGGNFQAPRAAASASIMSATGSGSRNAAPAGCWGSTARPSAASRAAATTRTAWWRT